MDPVENMRATAQELITYAQEQGVDLLRFHIEGNLQKDQRWICLWRKDELPYSGPTDEKVGTLHYNLQGAISRLPNSVQQSGSAFQGVWSEAGVVDSIEQAFDLVKAWLLDGEEIDRLPLRSPRRSGMG